MSEISASIEETNALRAKLGLKPLKVGPETSSAQIAEDNLKRQREEETKKAHEDEVKKRIQKAKNKRELNKVVPGKGLGEASDEDDTNDVFKWTIKSRQTEKKRQAEAAARRERELQELDESYQAEYDESHLSGLRVGHDVSDFAEGEEKILTLKDSTIFENEEQGDELINVHMSEKQRLDKNLENKKKVNRPIYTGYDDDEFVMGKKKNILSQYDEVLGIEGEGEGFVIGKSSNIRRSAAGQEGFGQSHGGMSAREITNQKLKESAIALSYNKTQQVQDYYTKEEAEVTFKKSKKKKKSRSRKADNWGNEEDQEENSMEVDRPEPIDISDMNFVDDEDLQESLAKARRIATKKSFKKLTPEQIAKNLAESKSMEVDDDEAINGGLVISDVSEFVSNLSSSAVLIPSSRTTAPSKEKDAAGPDSAKSPTAQDTPKDDMDTEVSKDQENSAENFRSLTRAESEDEGGEDTPMEEIANDESETAASAAAPVLVEEPLVSSGLGATLALLKQKGAYETGSAEHVERSKVQSERAKWLAEAKLREVKLARELADQKARDRERARDKNYSTRERDREREYENQRREQQLLDEREARMKNYKPDIKLEYIDESGNRLSTKEAFRQLSHAFHGKTSGKMKTEKRMKKLEDEKRLMGMSSTDTPLNMVTALQERQKAAGSAHIVLAVGNRNVVPSKLASSGASGVATPVASGSRSGTASTLAAPTSTSSFAAPSATMQPTMSVSGVHAPNREKVAFGLKRKAEPAPTSGSTEESAPKKSRS